MPSLTLFYYTPTNYTTPYLLPLDLITWGNDPMYVYDGRSRTMPSCMVENIRDCKIHLHRTTPDH